MNNVWRKAWQDRVIRGWVLTLAAFLLLAITSPLWLPSPLAQNPAQRLLPPGIPYLLGTDEFGRDILSRLLLAGLISLGMATAVTACVALFGVAIGLIAGYYSRTSGVLMRAMDALMSFPAIVLAIALAAVLNPISSVLSEFVALTVVFIPYLARVVRSRTVALTATTYVLAAKAGGVRGGRILFTHILPNATPAVIAQGIFIFASVLLADAALSFLGLGVTPPVPTWGNMIADGRSYMSVAPTYILFPGLAIVITVVALQHIGDRMRALIDPRALALTQLRQLQSRSRQRKLV